MKILFINPPLQRLKGIGQIYFPMGLAYLCAVVSSNKRVDAMIYNAETPDFSERLLFHAKYQDLLKLHRRYIEALQNDNHYVWQEIYKVISEFRPDIVGLSVMTAKYGTALKISQITKIINRNCRIIWGGPHPTIDPDRVMRNPEVDFVVRGEGEITLKDLINLLADSKDYLAIDLSKIEGLSYKIDSKIYHNPYRKLIEDLDALPFPNRNRLFFSNRYLPSSFGDITTTRGCPFLCGYCGAHNIWTHKIRYRTLDAVLEEIEAIISKHNTKEFYFLDDNFTLDKSRILDFCHLVRNTKMHITWSCSTRVDLVDDLIIKEMKLAGCNKISLGIESGSERILKNIRKDITLKKAISATELFNKYRMAYELYFLIGFPDETPEDIERTFSCMKRMKNAKIHFSIFTPYPGTQQYGIAKKYNLIPEEPDWSRFSHQSPDNHFMRHVTKEQFGQYVRKISLWADENNSRNTEIARLFGNSCLNLGSLIKRPELIVNKLKTFSSIIKNKINVLFKAN